MERSSLAKRQEKDDVVAIVAPDDKVMVVVVAWVEGGCGLGELQ